MDSDGIFLIREGQPLVLRRTPYESEALLQEALAKYPDVLAGTSTKDGAARALCLIKREMGVPKAEGAGAFWSLDHLFVDADGTPVAVEVKRSADGRIRREVVGQMLEYAANAVRYWPVDKLRADFDAAAMTEGTTGESKLHDLDPELDVEQFWETFASNLKIGKVRMIFVSDDLPPELERIIEFLNEQMSPAEVLGVEVPQYVGEGQQVLVPRVVGRTSAAQATKQSTGQQWDEGSFLERALLRHGSEHGEFFERLFQHARKFGVRVNWGRGLSPGASGWYELNGVPTPVWNVNVADQATSKGGAYVQAYLPEVRKRATSDCFATFVDQLTAIPAYKAKMQEARQAGFDRKYPSIFVTDLLADPASVEQFFNALDALRRNEVAV